MWHQRSGEVKEIVLDVCDQYTLQGDNFSQAILNNTPVPTSIEDAVANMRVIEAIVASAKSGSFVALSR
jgi:predicted dehydrogenase